MIDSNKLRFAAALGFLKDECKGWRGAEIAWLVFCVASVLALSWWWDEPLLSIIAAATGVAYTIFAGKGKISCFLFGLANAPIYAFISWKSGYYGDMALNLYYTAMMVSGIVSWRRHRTGDGEKTLVSTSLAPRELALWIAAMALSSLFLWLVLDALGGKRPVCDSLTNVLSVAAMLLTVRRAVEQWALWIAVDAIEIFMWFKVWEQSGSSVSILLMWVLFLLNGIYLWRVWLRSTVREPVSYFQKSQTAQTE